MKRASLFTSLLLVAFAAAASAGVADVAGEWTLSYRTRDGQTHTSTLTLKVDGNQVSGTLSSHRGSVAIEEGKVEGDNVSFSITRVGFGDKIRIDYSGKVSGDMMTLTMRIGARDPVDLTARRGA